MQELWPYVTPRRASSSYRLHVHTFVMHVPGWKVGPLRVYNNFERKNIEDEDCARRKKMKIVLVVTSIFKKSWSL